MGRAAKDRQGAGMKRQNGCRKFIVMALLAFYGTFSAMCLFNFIVDPFNMNQVFNFGFKKDIVVSYGANTRLYKLFAYRNNPLPNVLLGDSRMASFNTDIINKYTGGGGLIIWRGAGRLFMRLSTVFGARRKTPNLRTYILA
jgi:hypothetical protein